MTELNELMKRFSIRFAVILLVLVGIASNVRAQVGHHIEITVSDMPDSSFVLAYYYNESTYTRDTIKADANGHIELKGEDVLIKGVYILVLESTKSKLFDFAVYDDQHFSLVTDSKDFYRNMKVEGDISNRLFFENLIFNAVQNGKAAPFTAKINDKDATDEEKRLAKINLDEINSSVDQFQERVISEKESNLVSKILKARKQIKIPNELNGDDEKTLKARYYYYKSRFWTNVDMQDDALLRLPFPLIMSKMDEYFDKVVFQHPDSIIAGVNEVVAMAKPNLEMYKFVVWALTSKYYSPQIMGLDEVFVFLSDTYFSTGEMDFWANQQLKDNVKDRASKLRLSMIGMPGQNLIMQDQELQSRSMHDIKNKYTILYFYDPDCGHCKEETPVLVDFAKATSFDVQVFSICADTSIVKMKKYISEMEMNEWINVNGPRSYVGHYQELYDAFQTPTLYILDEKKKIIGKKLPAERLEEFLSNYEKSGK